MRPLPPLLRLAVLAMLLAAPFAGAQQAPPADAERGGLGGGVTLAYWVGPDNATADVEVAQGGEGTLWFAFFLDAPTHVPDANETADGNATGDGSQTAEGNGTAEPAPRAATAYVNLSSDVLGFATQNLTIPLVADANWSLANVSFSVPADAPESAPWTAQVEVVEETENGTVTLASSVIQGAVGVEVPQPPPVAPGIPTTWLAGGAAALLLVAVGWGAVAARQRRERRAMRGRTRSQALREVELEQKMEKAPEPERVQIQQEIRQQEKVREKRRDLQILEAKRADVLKTMDLLKKRHEMGGLTKLQYDNMVAKKQADLQRIEAEIASMEAEGDRGGSAAA